MDNPPEFSDAGYFTDADYIANPELYEVRLDGPPIDLHPERTARMAKIDRGNPLFYGLVDYRLGTD
jgi:hypothetical protein